MKKVLQRMFHCIPLQNPCSDIAGECDAEHTASLFFAFYLYRAVAELNDAINDRETDPIALFFARGVSLKEFFKYVGTDLLGHADAVVLNLHGNGVSILLHEHVDLTAIGGEFDCVGEKVEPNGG